MATPKPCPNQTWLVFTCYDGVIVGGAKTRSNQAELLVAHNGTQAITTVPSAGKAYTNTSACSPVFFVYNTMTGVLETSLTETSTFVNVSVKTSPDLRDVYVLASDPSPEADIVALLFSSYARFIKSGLWKVPARARYDALVAFYHAA